MVASDWPRMVPELSVTDVRGSWAFYVDVLGWQVLYERPEQGFAMLDLHGARLMLDQLGLGRDFDATLTGDQRPFGRGLNLEIAVPDVAPLLDRLDQAGIALHLPPEDACYRAGGEEVGQRQFVVADPDGYLLRFAQSLGRRTARSA